MSIRSHYSKTSYKNFRPGTRRHGIGINPVSDERIAIRSHYTDPKPDFINIERE
jgi:hypothetical protein